MKCSFCDGPFHPATGCWYAARMVSCYRCTVEFWNWFREHQNKRPRGSKGKPAVSFYYAAGKKW